MPNFTPAISQIRESICGILRTREIQVKPKKNKPLQRKFNIGFVGTGWCIVENRYIVTAHHVFDEQRHRVASDRFVVFSVPKNGDIAYHSSATGFPYEDPTADMAILEIAPSKPFHLAAVPVTFRRPSDGESVLTCGFPAPIIGSAQVDQNGDWAGGQILLKSHANEGIVSAQYSVDSAYAYELNVGWHHGESGGPILSLEPVAVFALMQFYRNIKGPHGVVPGPHMGRSLAAIESKLKELGAKIV